MSLHVRPSPEDPGVDASTGCVHFIVTDTGIGIDSSDQLLIFESFKQVDGSTTRHYGGSGLGSAICKELTELMRGTVSVASELGSGATFTVRVPPALR